VRTKTVYTCTDGQGSSRYSCDPNDLDDRYAVGPRGGPAKHFKSRTLFKITNGSYLVSCLSPGFRFNKDSQRYVRADGGTVGIGQATPRDVYIAGDAEAALNWLVNE
jgi:hypothetical protein